MLKIFLVDDSGLVRRRLSALISALAGVVIVGESEEADTALACIHMTRADLVIVDPHLAGGNGMEIVESLARATPPVLTMVLTNHSGPAFRAACHHAGAGYFFDKTCEYELARDTIERLASGSTDKYAAEPRHVSRHDGPALNPHSSPVHPFTDHPTLLETGMTSATACASAASNVAPFTYMAHAASMNSPPAATRPDTNCSACSLHSICMPSQLSVPELARLDAIVCSTRLVRRGETLYRAGDAFKSIYAVRVGCFKTVITHRDGHEQVTGFHIAGEPLGLDGVCSDEQNCDAIALEDSKVCVIPFDLLEDLCHDVKAMQQHVHRMMSGEIVRESGLMMMLGTMTAQQRVAAFLINLSSRMKIRGYSAAQFNLRMTREEIGSYLGLKLETVSRMFSKLQKAGVIDTNGKQVHILDSEKLAGV